MGKRGLQIASMVAEAKSNKEIAYLTGLTYSTVKEYLNHIFKETGTTNRTELALWYLKQTGRLQ